MGKKCVFHFTSIHILVGAYTCTRRPPTTKAEERICNLIHGSRYSCSAVVSSLCCSSSALFKVKYAVDKSWYLLILHLSRASVHFIQELEDKPRWALYAGVDCPDGTVYSKDWTLCAVVEEQEKYKTNWWEILIFTSMQFPLDLFSVLRFSRFQAHHSLYLPVYPSEAA